MKQGTLYKIKT